MGEVVQGVSEVTYSSEVIKDWIESIQSTGHDLTKWERDFVESVAGQLEERGWISDRQEEILERIYAERT